MEMQKFGENVWKVLATNFFTAQKEKSEKCVTRASKIETENLDNVIRCGYKTLYDLWI